MLKIYTYSKCSTCREALHFLTGHRQQFHEIAIREQPPSRDELRRMLTIYGGDMRRLFNTSGQDYRALDLKTRLPRMSTDETIELLSRNGNLVKRPFLLTPTGGRVGFKEEEWSELLGLKR